MIIQVRRGLEANRTSYTPQIGEPVFTTDEKKLYIGDGTTPGGILVDMQSGVQTIIAGTNITVDATDPANPIVSATLDSAVDSVNGLTGAVVLDADDISDASTTKKFATAAEKTKLGFIAVTQAVDLDAIEANANNVPGIKTKTDFITVTQAVDLDVIETNANNVPAIKTKTDFITVTQAVDLDTMESKLAGIEVGADVTDAANVASAGAFMKATDDTDDITEGATNKWFTVAEETKLAGIETAADVTDTANVTTAGALMDSEVTNLAAVKAFDPADYATDTQGATADTAVQPGDLATVATTGVYSDLTGKPTIPTSVDDLSPSQTGHSGKFLKTDGTDASWEAIPGGGDMLAAIYDPNAHGDDAFDQDNMTDGATNKNYTATEKTKLAGIETAADVTDTANVTAAGALMDSEVDADIKTLSLPASTTISAFGASLVDDADAAAARTTIGLGNANNTSDATKQAATLLAAFPVGSIYINTSNTNPGTFIGGTWAAFGAGRVPVGFDSGQTEFDTDEETGGAKTVTLTAAEMPSHTHTQNSHNHTQDAHSHQERVATTSTSGTGITGTANLSGNTGANQTTAATTATNQAATATNQNTGGDGAHNNLQPYIVVRMWKRTA